jgi:hypothetical protein
MIFGNWLWPLRRRQLLSAASASYSLKIMASAVLLERDILARLPISQIREVTAAAIAGVTLSV